MNKKFFFVLLVFSMTAGLLFAQESSTQRAQNNVSASFGLIGADLSYERIFSKHFSVLADVSYTTLIVMDEFTVAAKGRIYPFGGAFFLDLGLGFTYGKGAVSSIGDLLLTVLTFGWWLTQEDEVFGSTGGFLVQPGLGWKFDIGKQDHFVLPLSMGLDIKMGEVPDFLPFLRIGLGYSF